MEYDVIIAAAGLSQRAGVDKLELNIDNKTVIQMSIELFEVDKDCKNIIIVTNKNKLDTYRNKYYGNSRFKIALGSNFRQESIYQGLMLCKSEYVMIHDAARPFTSNNMINKLKSKLITHDAIIPVVNVVNTLIEKKGTEIRYLNRDNILGIQTPQAFKTDKIISAYENVINKLSTYSDDSRIYYDTFANKKYFLLEGEVNNIKITYASDINEWHSAKKR